MSYSTDGLQQTEVNADEPVKVFVREPETLHIKIQLCFTSNVRHLLRQDLTAQHQWKVFGKAFEEFLCRNKNKITISSTFEKKKECKQLFSKTV